MDRYSKINIMSHHSKNSRSIDSSDLQSFSPTQKSITIPTTKKALETNLQMNKCNNNSSNTTQDQKGDDEDDEQCNTSTGGDRFGSVVILKRNNSVSSFSAASSSSSGFQSALKGAFSMRRSSSVSERYCRIHDQSATTMLTSPIDDEEDQAAWGATRSMKKKHRGGKIFKVCKRFFGL